MKDKWRVTPFWRGIIDMVENNDDYLNDHVYTRPNLEQNNFEWRVFKFVQIKGPLQGAK